MLTGTGVLLGATCLAKNKYLCLLGICLCYIPVSCAFASLPSLLTVITPSHLQGEVMGNNSAFMLIAEGLSAIIGGYISGLNTRWGLLTWAANCFIAFIVMSVLELPNEINMKSEETLTEKYDALSDDDDQLEDEIAIGHDQAKISILAQLILPFAVHSPLLQQNI